jgi:hypothetical protein
LPFQLVIPVDCPKGLKVHLFNFCSFLRCFILI